MNHKQTQPTEKALSTWTVETKDLTSRVSAATGSEDSLANELAALRREVADLRVLAVGLQNELHRLKSLNRKAIRISPFCASENAARLS